MRRFLIALLAVGASACADRAPLPASGVDGVPGEVMAAHGARWEREVRARAAAGDVDARGRLAVVAWIEGTPGAVDSLRAVAPHGSALAARTLASAYQSGRGVAVDHEAAADWLAVAARLGDPESARDLAAYRRHAG